MDAYTLVANDLGAEFKSVKIGEEDKPYLVNVSAKPWRQSVSTHSSRHLVQPDIIPETEFWNANYPAFFARNRVNALQLFLHPAAKQSLDALVCIAGNDGDNNKGSTQLLAYLLQGKNANELESKDVTETNITSESVLIADAHSVSLWTSAEQPYIGASSEHTMAIAANWRNCQVWQHVLSDDTRDDYELAKIKFFVDYFRSPDSRAGVQAFANKETSAIVGLPFDPTADITSVDQWPLVQAFALGDGVGAGTFFTLQHNVKSCAHVIRDLQRNVDAQALRVAALCHTTRLQKHWNDSVNILSGIRSAGNRAQVCEVDIAEALSTFFDFGQMGHKSKSGLTSATVFNGGRVLVGARSSSAGAKHTGAQSSDEVTIAGESHFTIEGQDALSGLRAARSYFLTVGTSSSRPSSVAARRLYEEMVESHQGCLEQLGGLLSQHVRNIIDGRPGVLSLGKLESALARHVASDLSERASEVFEDDPASVMAAFESLSANDNWVSVHVHGIDAAGNSVSDVGSEFLADIYRRYFYLELRIDLGVEEGALIVGDTVPSMVLRGNAKDRSATWPALPLVLTAGIPYFKAWQSVAEETAQNASVLASLDDAAFISDDVVRFDAEAAAAAHPTWTGAGLGEDTGEIIRDCLVLLNGDDDDEDDDGDEADEDPSLSVPHQRFLYGDLQLRNSGFVLRVPGIAPIPVSLFDGGNDVKRAAVVDLCPRELSLLYIELSETARDVLFSEDRLFFVRRSTAIAVALPVGGEVKRKVVGRLGRLCKSPEGIDVSSFKYALDGLEMFRAASVAPYLQAAAEQDCLLVNRKIVSLSGGDADDTTIESDDEELAPGGGPEAAILITGSTHSGKVAVATSVAEELVRVGVNKSIDCVYNADLGEPSQFDLKHLSQWLISRRQKRAEAVQKQSPGVVVLVAPDFVCAPAAVTQLQRLRSPKFSDPGVQLQASIHTINAASYSVEGATSISGSPPSIGTLPEVFQSLVPGFVSSVVLCNCGTRSASDAVICLRQLVETLTSGTDGAVDIVRAVGGAGDSALQPQFSISELLPFTLLNDVSRSKRAQFRSAGNRNLRNLTKSAVAARSPKTDRTPTFAGSVYNRLCRSQLDFAAKTQKGSVKFSSSALRLFITELFSKDSSSARLGDVFAVSGTAYVQSDSGPAAISFYAAAPRYWACQDLNGDRAWSSASTSAAQGSAVFVWDKIEMEVTGAGIRPAAIEQAFIQQVLEGGDLQQEPRQLSVETLTDAEKEEIKRQHISDPLPQGFYFDGANYINADRRIQKYHPDMDKFMAEYVAVKTSHTPASQAAAVVNDMEITEEDAL